MAIGYARIKFLSRKDWMGKTLTKVEAEHEAVTWLTGTLQHCGASMIFIDGLGTKDSPRPQLHLALGLLRPGDEFIITSLTDLGRTNKEMFSTLETILSNSYQLIIARPTDSNETPPIRFVGECGKQLALLCAEISYSSAQLSTTLTRIGMEEAAARGRKGGRPKTINDARRLEIAEYAKANNLDIYDAAERLGYSKEALLSYEGKHSDSSRS